MQHMPNVISVSHFTHILTHTYMAWKSVMSSTSHHALFLCSEVSEANGNSSFPPSTPTRTFILSFLLSFSPHPHPLHWGAALICIEEEPPPQALKFPPIFLPLHLNNLLLTLLLDFTCFHSHHLFSAPFHPYFTFSDWLFLFFPSDLTLSTDILPILPSYSLPSVTPSQLYRSINHHFLHSVAPLQHPIVAQKQSRLPLSPLTTTHPPGYPCSFRLGLAG